MVTPLEPGRTSLAPEGGVVAAQGPVHLALLSFEDQVAPGVTQAVQAMQLGTWRDPTADPASASTRRLKDDCLDVVMLTGACLAHRTP